MIDCRITALGWGWLSPIFVSQSDTLNGAFYGSMGASIEAVWLDDVRQGAELDATFGWRCAGVVGKWVDGGGGVTAVNP